MKIKKNLSLFEGGVIVSSRDTREIGRITTQESTLRKKKCGIQQRGRKCIYTQKHIKTNWLSCEMEPGYGNQMLLDIPVSIRSGAGFSGFYPKYGGSSLDAGTTKLG